MNVPVTIMRMRCNSRIVYRVNCNWTNQYIFLLQSKGEIAKTPHVCVCLCEQYAHSLSCHKTFHICGGVLFFRWSDVFGFFLAIDINSMIRKITDWCRINQKLCWNRIIVNLHRLRDRGIGYVGNDRDAYRFEIEK